jgi:hypothetical protein
MKQVPTVSGKPEGAMRSAPFVRGFKDARAGKPLNYEAFPYTGDQWQYERGRHFALIFNGALKDGARLTYDARRAFHTALRERAII